MPNHVIHSVTISGSKKSIKKFITENINVFAYGDGSIAEFSFQTIIPRPKSLDIVSGTQTKNAKLLITGTEAEKEAIRQRYALDKDKYEEMIALGKVVISNEKLYGHSDWYDWNIENWGTKWDCYEVSVDCSDTFVNLWFQTAWNTPLKVFRELSKKYPDLNIEVDYADEDLGYNCGTYSLFQGEITSEELKDETFARNLWGYDAY